MKARVDKSMESCVRMMIEAASERQERNLYAQLLMFVESLRIQRERDDEARSDRKKENTRKLRALKSMM